MPAIGIAKRRKSSTGFLHLGMVTRCGFHRQLSQASMSNAIKWRYIHKLYREIKFKCIPGLAEGSGTPISPEELMSRYGFKIHLLKGRNSCCA